MSLTYFKGAAGRLLSQHIDDGAPCPCHPAPQDAEQYGVHHAQSEKFTSIGLTEIVVADEPTLRENQEAWAIVGEFAESEPMDSATAHCIYCGRGCSGDNDPDAHLATCPWRRAKRLIGT